jgi:hypothetical protein
MLRPSALRTSTMNSAESLRLEEVDGERPFDRLRVVPSEVEGRSRTTKFFFHLFLFAS